MRTQEQTILDAALDYIKHGLPVFPVHKPTQAGCSCRRKSCAQVGKHPATPNGFKDASLSVEQVRKWFEGKYKGYNIAVLCGIGYVCLDVDPKNGGIEAFEELIQDHDPLPDTWVEETGENKSGERGSHYWFTLPKELIGEAVLTRKPLPGYLGVDLLASKQYAIVAPSLHASGVQYDTIVPLGEVAEAPDWLLSLTRVRSDERFFDSADSPFPTGIEPGPEIKAFLKRGDVPPGAQQPMVIKTARALWGMWEDVESATERIWAAIQKCEWSGEPWTREQVAFHVAHTFSSAPQEPDIETELEYNDFGNALRLWLITRGNMKYCPQVKTWYHWDETCWREDHANMINQMVTALSLKELQRAAYMEDSDRAGGIRKNARNLQYVKHENPCVTKAERLPEFVITTDEFDTDRYLLNCRNITVDLRTGKCYEQKREDLITRTTGAAYYEGRRSELWEEMIDLALAGDQDLIEYIQLAFGQALFGVTHEHAFYYLHGPGGTGKTTVLEAIVQVLGSYAGVADPETFMQSPHANPGGTRADLASLKGKRFVISTEIQAQSKFSTATVNRLTGNDTITVRIPYARGMLVFKPEWTLFFAANHFPSVSASKRDGFWRRVKVIPFEHQIPSDQMNPVLLHLLGLREHKEGILTWLVEGAVKWWGEYGSQKKTMVAPHDVKAEVERQAEEADPLLGFYHELIFEEGARVDKAALHEYYRGWCEKEGTVMAWSSQKLSRHLKAARGLEDIDSGGSWKWLGVRIPGNRN